MVLEVKQERGNYLMLAQVASEANGQVATVLFTLDSSLALRALAQHGALDAWEEILAHEIVS